MLFTLLDFSFVKEKWKWAGLFGLGRDNGCVLQLRAAVNVWIAGIVVGMCIYCMPLDQLNVKRWAGTLNSLEWAEKLQGKSQSWSLEGVKTNC
ncbi:hypothetical protein KY284_016508 [Solanum tuberosum]|nr:hypothetical protein KY284_016508 [Solanum tuberosum]